jgi:hypothetical protein
MSAVQVLHIEKVTDNYRECLCEKLPLQRVFDELLANQDCKYIQTTRFWEDRYVSVILHSILIQQFVSILTFHLLLYLSRVNWLLSTANMGTATCLTMTRLIFSLLDGWRLKEKISRNTIKKRLCFRPVRLFNIHIEFRS